ncbi:hypothetical protein ACQJBY_012463 [Aegilops geniculata]
MSPVRVIHASYVNVPATAAPPPGPIKLTAMEAQWVVVPVLQHVLLYEGEDLPHFDDLLQSLRSSLAATLRSFAPLAGKLVHLEGTGDVAIVCSSSDGISFVVAESDADIHRLAGDEKQDVHVLERVVPEGRAAHPRAGRAGHALRGRRGGRGDGAPRRRRRAVAVDVRRGVGDGVPRRDAGRDTVLRPLARQAAWWPRAGQELLEKVRAKSTKGGISGAALRGPCTVDAPDVHRGRAGHPAPQGAHRASRRILRRGPASPPVHLHRRRRARLDVLRPVQAVRLGRRRDGRFPRGCPAPPRPSRRRGILRRVPHRMHSEPPRARAPRRARPGGRGAGGAGGGPQEDGGPDGRLRFPGTGVHGRHGTADERVWLVELPGLRAGGLRVGQADADGEHQDDPRRAGGADARQGRAGSAGIGLAARTSANGRVQVSVARVSRLNVGSTPPFILLRV